MEDVCVWSLEPIGMFTIKSMWNGLRSIGPSVSWALFVWNKHLPPRLSILGWLWVHGKMLTDDMNQAKAVHLPSRCDLCVKNAESFIHLFLECSFYLEIWSKTVVMFNVAWKKMASVNELINWWKNKGKGWSLKDPWMIGMMITIAAIWNERNARRYKDKNWCLSMIYAIKREISFVCSKLKFSSKSVDDLILCRRFHFENASHVSHKTLEIHWGKPMRSWAKLNVNGCSLGNSGRARRGGILQDHNGRLLLCFNFFLGVTTSFIVEIVSID
ncbi:uncharacterized protein LOC122067575 [Macadamia integrifolia]|uniref:uncharacterized protein LOC122067575 n=1 Tax=Macadamia integrifolia TaxID=60698 RepID=UPI001C4F662E|nr:uncharacterized protein LOC122067575 [Macadamia integrifolia]